jgi:hypothetical protein
LLEIGRRFCALRAVERRVAILGLSPTLLVARDGDTYEITVADLEGAIKKNLTFQPATQSSSTG